MGLIETASANSFWRGVDYYNKAKSMSKRELIEELVLAWLRIEDCESDRYCY